MDVIEETKIEKVIEAIRNGEHDRKALVNNPSLGTPSEVTRILMRLYLRGITKVWYDGRMVDLA